MQNEWSLVFLLEKLVNIQDDLEDFFVCLFRVCFQGVAHVLTHDEYELSKMVRRFP